MIDTHCHLLPGLDDGPATPEASLSLASVLCDQGVRTVLCTPHLSRRYPTRGDDAERAARPARGATRRGIALDLKVAAELADEVAVRAPLGELRRRSVSGRYLLVEVQPATPAEFFALVTTRIARAGLLPIFAHPERSRAVQRDVHALDDVRAGGALVQAVAPSIVGRWGREVEAAVWSLLESDRVDLIGSDAHGVQRRRCHLQRAAELVATRIGVDAAAELTERRPGDVLDRQAATEPG